MRTIEELHYAGMTPIEELVAFIHSATVAYRKGDEVEHKINHGVEVVTLNGYPEVPDRGVLVDVHFLQIGFTEAAAIEPKKFLDMVEAAEHGIYCSMTLDRLTQGPSYIETGGWLGSQDTALRFIALGAHLGIWDAITPATLHLTGDRADQAAGMGLVMNGPVKR